MLTRAPSALAVTLTLGHRSSTPIAEAFEALYEVKREFHRGGGWSRLMNTHGVVGFQLVTEFTFSEETGPHPHFHGFYFSKQASSFDAESLADALVQRWVHSAHRLGYEASTGSQSAVIVPARSRARMASYLGKDHADNWWPHDGRDTIGSIRRRAVHLDPYARTLYDELVLATAGRDRTVTTPNLAGRLAAAADSRSRC